MNEDNDKLISAVNSVAAATDSLTINMTDFADSLNSITSNYIPLNWVNTSGNKLTVTLGNGQSIDLGPISSCDNWGIGVLQDDEDDKGFAMHKFNITEVNTKTISILAKNKDEAEKILADMLDKGEIDFDEEVDNSITTSYIGKVK